MENKILELAKKLKALADRGIEGEKENAIQMLERHLKKHNITIEQLEGIEKEEHFVFIAPEDKSFFMQIASSVCGDDFRVFYYKYKTKREPGKDRCSIECQESEFIEIMAKFEFYLADFKEQMKLFKSAYIQKNKLYKKQSHSENQQEYTELSAEEKARLWKITNMMEGIERVTFLKQLGS